MSMDTLTVVRDFLKQRIDLDPPRVTADAALADLGVDSLILLELMFECEERLDVKIADDTEPPKTVGDLLAIVARMSQNAARG